MSPWHTASAPHSATALPASEKKNDGAVQQEVRHPRACGLPQSTTYLGFLAAPDRTRGRPALDRDQTAGNSHRHRMHPVHRAQLSLRTEQRDINLPIGHSNMRPNSGSRLAACNHRQASKLKHCQAVGQHLVDLESETLFARSVGRRLHNDANEAAYSVVRKAMVAQPVPKVYHTVK